jgi:anaerobic magnesium-protoporphyrin IX monomethyl ester cyclase
LLNSVLLTHSNHLFSDPKQTQKMQPYPPLQTLLAAAQLRHHGIHAQLFDSTLVHDPRAEFAHAIASHHPHLVVVCEDDFNFLTKMCLSQNRDLAFHMAAVARNQGLPITAHGHDASEHPDAYLAAGFDSVITGEVEDALVEMALGTPSHEIAGLVWKDDQGRMRRNPRRELRADLDALPLPAWDLVQIDRYRAAWHTAHGYFSMNMVSSRGCPYRCNWCAKPIHGNSYHARSPRAVAEEMRLLKTLYKPDQIWFADDIFALSHRWTLDFSNAVAELDAAIPFRMQSRCDLMTRDTVSALSRAGAGEIWMGAESGSQRILDAMDKGIKVAHIYEARENLKRHNIRACFFLQFGYPGEGWNEIEATLRMVRETRPDDIGVSVSYPLPGTAFHNMVSARIGPKENWRDSSDLAMLFQGAYSTNFYRALAEALHLEVRTGDSVATQDAWSRVVAQARVPAVPELTPASAL